MRTPRNPRPGQCHVCGCSHYRACADGCAWANAEQTLCTRCCERIIDCTVLRFFSRLLTPVAQLDLLQEIAR